MKTIIICPNCGSDRVGIRGTAVYKDEYIIARGCGKCNHSWSENRLLSKCRKYINSYTKFALKALSIGIDSIDCDKLDCSECPFICVHNTAYYNLNSKSFRKKETVQMKNQILH